MADARAVLRDAGGRLFFIGASVGMHDELVLARGRRLSTHRRRNGRLFQVGRRMASAAPQVSHTITGL